MAKIEIKRKDIVEQEVKEAILRQEYEESLPSVESRLESIAFAIQKLIRVDELTEEELSEMISLFPTWESALYRGKQVEKDTKYVYNGRLYKVVTPHIPQENWNPEKDNGALWDEVVPPGVIDEWEQRYGHNAYQPGDKVIWEGEVYEAKSVTTYDPTSYPAAWLKK